MKTYLTKTPSLIMRLFSNYIWRFSISKKEIYLTFDDGPTPEITHFVLNELKKYKAKATFFCIGKNIDKYPEIFEKIVAENHSIGNHTQNHLNALKTNKKTYLDNFLKCEKKIDTISKKLNYTLEEKLFRPPYGKIRKNQAKEILKKGYKIIMWDVLSADFDNLISKENCLKNVLKNTKKGSIVVFHDSIKASEKVKYALPKVLDYFSSKGYTFVKI